MKNNEQNVKDLQDIIKYDNISIIGIPHGEKGIESQGKYLKR